MKMETFGYNVKFQINILISPLKYISIIKVQFMTKIWHPNIWKKYICLDVLKEKWRSTLSLRTLTLSLILLLENPNGGILLIKKILR